MKGLIDLTKPIKEIPIDQQFLEIATLDKNTGKSPDWEITAENIAKLFKIDKDGVASIGKFNWYFSDDKQYLSLETTIDNIVIRFKMNPLSMFLNVMEHLRLEDDQSPKIPSEEIRASFIREMSQQILKNGDKIEHGIKLRDQVKLGLKAVCYLRGIEEGKPWILPETILNDLVEKTMLNLEHDALAKDRTS